MCSTARKSANVTGMPASIFFISPRGEGQVGANGGPEAKPGYQVDLAAEFKQPLKVPVIAVGMLDDYHAAQEVVLSGKADLVAIGRGCSGIPTGLFTRQGA